MSFTTPTLDLERELIASGAQYVAGVDEVGRGALAGPVSVGVAIVCSDTGPVPTGLRDSKQISRQAREKLIAPVSAWVVEYAIGHVAASEIDQIGIVPALRLAWVRAHQQLAIKPDHVILDGKHNWLIEPESNLLTAVNPPISEIEVPVTMRVKADATCAAVSAASVLAKVARDELMREAALIYPDFGWEGNVGYGSAEHMAAIARLGATDLHRKSWNLPTGPSNSDQANA
ncbi:MAG: ribonuclease HII [Actinobacteria bacterium]|nr:ribonuclease HII [Actinomycetota bacterium]